MPNLTVYLNEEDYVSLSALAAEQGTRASLLARQAIQDFLRKKIPLSEEAIKAGLKLVQERRYAKRGDS